MSELSIVLFVFCVWAWFWPEKLGVWARRVRTSYDAPLTEEKEQP